MSGGAGLLRVPAGAEMLGNVVGCGLDQQQRARVIDAFRSRVGLDFLEKIGDLTEALRKAVVPVDVIILPAIDRDGQSGAIERAVRQLAIDRPRTAIVIYCPPSARYTSGIRALTAAGAHQFVFAGIDDQGATFRAVLQAARRGCAAEWVMQQLGPIVPGQLHRMVEAMLSHPDRVTSLPTLAAELGVHRKTLFNWCDRAKFLPPAELLAWARLTLVAYYLESTGCTIERIALDLSYASPTTLRNTIKRYTHLRATEIRRGGGVQRMLDAFRARVDSAEMELHNT